MPESATLLTQRGKARPTAKEKLEPFNWLGLVYWGFVFHKISAAWFGHMST